MRWYEKYSGLVERVIFVIKSFMELDKFNHETIVRTGDWSFLFDKRLGFFVVVTVFKDDVSDNKGDGSWDTLDAVDEYILFVFMSILDEVDDSVEETLNILVLRVFEEESKVGDTRGLEPVLAVVSCTVDDMFDLVFLEDGEIFGDFLSGEIESLYDLTALLLTLFPFASSLFGSVGDGCVV